MPEIPLPIRTERLILRRFSGSDLDAFHAYHSLPETARFLPGPAKTYTQSMERVGQYANFVFEKEGDWAAMVIEVADSLGLPGPRSWFTRSWPTSGGLQRHRPAERRVFAGNSLHISSF